VDEDVMAAAREPGDEATIFMLMKKFDESAVTEDVEFGSMFGNLFE
jgi:hypothetical protein